MEMSLRKTKKNQKYQISKIIATGELGRRIRDMGIVPGTSIKMVGEAPLFDPVMVKYKDTVLTLRNNEADSIIVNTGRGQ
ncbi:MAG: ferrous iron transport protein A [Bacteriovoracaceae bacterium]|nr:ferrous iron transport protein A [Bacteriovoracaceae bacterium]